MTTLCPECEYQLTVPDQPSLNEVLECGECRTELEVVATAPVMLALAPEIEEDWGE
ncbi:MAG: lysine biosynthesis protein LysW [Jatrophihabitantaceae bacterium]